jgi:FAD/FMN-containing dehydrogenase
LSIDTATLIARFAGIVGTEHVLTAEAEREFYAEDIFRRFETPLAVVAPANVAQLSAIAATCHTYGIAMVPRGAGYSYTDGYLHTRSTAITIDTRRLNRILEVNPVDMYVTVEVGASWAKLDAALKKEQLRTPYWGPMSGYSTTVGGALSQNSVLFGSGQYGSAVEQVLGLTVVLADGSIVPTGAHATRGGKPFMKHYGPDLMGPFLADAGALGIKAIATLRVIRRPLARRHGAFAFSSAGAMAQAMSSMMREGLLCECMGFDSIQGTARVTDTGGNLLNDLRTLRKVVQGGGIKDGLRIALAGRRYLEGVPFSLHYAIEDKSEKGVGALAAQAKEICRGAGGRALASELTRIVHAAPFLPVDNLLGAKGERWVPVHCIVPHSQASTMIASVQSLFERYRERAGREGVRTGFLVVALGNYGFLIEPVFYWPDARLAAHERLVRVEHLARLPKHAANEAGRATVAEMRDALAALFVEAGAVSLQLGKFYLYDRSREPAAWQLLEKVKALVDPDGLMNPGALRLP